MKKRDGQKLTKEQQEILKAAIAGVNSGEELKEEQEKKEVRNQVIQYKRKAG